MLDTNLFSDLIFVVNSAMARLAISEAALGVAEADRQSLRAQVASLQHAQFNAGSGYPEVS